MSFYDEVYDGAALLVWAVWLSIQTRDSQLLPEVRHMLATLATASG